MGRGAGGRVPTLVGAAGSWRLPPSLTWELWEQEWSRERGQACWGQGPRSPAPGSTGETGWPALAEIKVGEGRALDTPAARVPATTSTGPRGHLLSQRQARPTVCAR